MFRVGNNRENHKKNTTLFYRADAKIHRRRSQSAGKAAEQKQKPYNLRATRPREIIEFDIKHINLPGRKLYALCGIDQFTRQPEIYISTSCSSQFTTGSIAKASGKTVTRAAEETEITITADSPDTGGFALSED